MNVGFCDDCLKLLKNDALAFMVCNPNHKLFQPPKVTKRLSKGIMLVGPELIEITKWLDKLREQWGV